MINWQYYPKSQKPPQLVLDVVDVFTTVSEAIDSAKAELDSNAVLSEVGPGLAAIGFTVETGKKSADKVSVPVLFGPQGRPEKTFDADAYHKEAGFVIEVEAGRAVVNNQFLKDLFQACMMQDVQYLAIAVRNT